MLAKLVKNLVHPESRWNCFDQDRGANGAARNLEFILSQIENIVPDAGLQMALHLRQIKIRSAPTIDQFARVVKKIQTKVEKRAGDWFSIKEHVLFIEMPAARPDE